MADDLAKQVLLGLRRAIEDKHPDEVGQIWREGRSREWTEWIVGHKDKPGVLENIAKSLGYKTVEYEWFRTDQYWYQGMSNNWDWDDRWDSEGHPSVAVEYENSYTTRHILYDIRKLCHVVVPVKLFVGYRARPMKLLYAIQEMIKKREQLRNVHYALVFGWLHPRESFEWKGYQFVLRDGVLNSTEL